MSQVQDFTDLDDILGKSVEDLAELRSFQALPIGVYRAIFNWEVNDERTGIIFIFNIAEVVELNNPAEADAVRADAQARFFNTFKKQDGTVNEMAEGMLRQVTTALRELADGSSAIEILDNNSGAEVRLTLGHRRNKEDPTSPFQSLRKIEIWGDNS